MTVKVVVRVRPCFDDESSCLSCGSGLVRLDGEGEELKDWLVMSTNSGSLISTKKKWMSLNH